MNHIILLNSANILVKYFSFNLKRMRRYGELHYTVFAEIGKHASKRTTEH